MNKYRKLKLFLIVKNGYVTDIFYILLKINLKKQIHLIYFQLNHCSHLQSTTYLKYMYFIENERRFSINFTTIVDQVNFSNSLRTLHLTCVGILNV